MWNAAYDGIGACNLAIETAPNCSFATDAERNAKWPKHHFLRAVYYYNLVEMFGGVVKLTAVQKANNYSPERTDALEIYRDVIIPDLRFAAEWLPVGNYDADANPTKKSALGYLAKACLATRQYDTTEFLQEGFDAARKLITDCEWWLELHDIHVCRFRRPVFKEANNKSNKEALWKYTVYGGKTHGSSNGNYRTNRNDEHFLCQLNHFGARIDNQAVRLAWDGGVQGDFMPTQHLLSLYVQDNGTLDPRFHKLFITGVESKSGVQLD